MLALADSDNNNMESTVKDLNAAIKAALSQDSKGSWRDIQGAKIEAVKDVTAFLQANLPNNIRLESVKLTSGWLSDGGDTTVAVPQPLRLAQVKAQAIRGGKYQAFSNIPALGRAFTFAGLGPSSSLVKLGILSRSRRQAHLLNSKN